MRVRTGPVRKSAVARVWAGERPSDVMRAMGLCRTTVYRWLRRAAREGVDALATRRPRGRKPLVSPEAAEALRARIVGRRPRDEGLDGDLWTLERVRALVRARLGVDVGRMGAGRVLDRLGLRFGRPLGEFARHDATAVHDWRRFRHRGLRDRCAAAGGRLLFLRLAARPERGGLLAAASDGRGAFYCEDVGTGKGRLVGFVRACARGVRRPPTFAFDDVATWAPVFAEARRSPGASGGRADPPPGRGVVVS
jgi:transposase